MIEFGNSSHVGLRRELNEDTYYSDSDLGLWLVADGMGGHEFGEVASALARDAVVREVRAGRSLSDAIRSADEDIIRQSRRRASTAGPKADRTAQAPQGDSASDPSAASQAHGRAGSCTSPPRPGNGAPGSREVRSAWTACSPQAQRDCEAPRNPRRRQRHGPGRRRAWSERHAGGGSSQGAWLIGGGRRSDGSHRGSAARWREPPRRWKRWRWPQERARPHGSGRQRCLWGLLLRRQGL